MVSRLHYMHNAFGDFDVPIMHSPPQEGDPGRDRYIRLLSAPASTSAAAPTRGIRGLAPADEGAAPAIFLLFWSGGFAAGKVGLAYIGPLTFLAVRYALVLLILLPLILIMRPPLPAHRRRGDTWQWSGPHPGSLFRARLPRAGDGHLHRCGGADRLLQPILVARLLLEHRESASAAGRGLGSDWGWPSGPGHPGAVCRRGAAGARGTGGDWRTAE